jgi:hypothetical protein
MAKDCRETVEVGRLGCPSWPIVLSKVSGSLFCLAFCAVHQAPFTLSAFPAFWESKSKCLRHSSNFGLAHFDWPDPAQAGLSAQCDRVCGRLLEEMSQNATLQQP